MAGKLASGGGKKKGMQPNSEPNVIPFIDVMLVLLIIFMVAAPMPTVDIRVDLPANPIESIMQGREPTNVAIEEENGALVYYVDGVSVPRSGLGDAVLNAAIRNNPSLPVEQIFVEASIIFRADQDTAYANVVSTMGYLQEEGWAKVSLFAERADV